MSYKPLATGFILVLLHVTWPSRSLAEENWVEVVPPETHEILANPGMGWETFHTTASADKQSSRLDPVHGALCAMGLGQVGAAARHNR